MKKKIISSVVALALIITSVTFLPSLYEKTVNNTNDPSEVTADSVIISQSSFPDDNFRNYVLELEKKVSGDNAGNGVLDKEELEQITSVIVSSLEIRDLKGIEYFTYLEVLNCSGNSIENLNLSHCKKLRELICSDNSLKGLDLNTLTALEKLDCSNNGLSELNVGDNPLLTELCCSNNPITQLNIRNNPCLQRFECSKTNLTSLSIENHIPFDAENEKEFDFFELENNSYTVFNCVSEAYDFDLTTLPGNFNIEKASEWNGAEPAEAILNGVKKGDTVTYSYDVGCGITARFSLTFEEGHNLTKVEDRSEICSIAPDLWQCSDCGKYFSDEEGTIEAEVVNGHSYNEGVVEKNATCTEEGVLLKTCTVCGHENREVIEMLPHNTDDKYEFDQYQHWKICHDCEQEVGREDHTFEGDSDICLVCGETIERHFHELVFVEEKAPTCTEEGIKEHYYCAGCEKYYADSEGNEEVNYSDLTIQKLEHQYETRYDEKEHWQECVLCGDKKDVQSHNLEEERTEPTCCADGQIKNVCHDCGYAVEIEVLPATGEHIFSEEYSADDDHHWFGCTNEECTARYEQTEHSYTGLEIAKNPTCSEEGVMNHICEICGHTKSEPIPVNETHTYGDKYVEIDEHTHAQACIYCGLPSDETEPHEFDKDNVKDIGEQHASTCKLCGAAAEAEDHVYDIQIVKANCFESGKLIYICKICGHSYEEETDPPTGLHSFSEDYTLDGNNHIHKCTAEGCPAVDTHDAAECGFNIPVDTEPVDTDPADTEPAETTTDNKAENNITVDVTITEVSTINIVWPTSVGVVFNPYRLKIKMTESEADHSVTFAESSDGSSETVLSNEMSFINKGDTEVKVTVKGSVSAVTTVDSNGKTLYDSEGNPTTRPSTNIVFTDEPINLFNIGNASRKNAILLYLEATTQFDSSGQHGVYSGVFDKRNENQMLLGTEETTKNLFNIAPKNGDKDGVTNLKICGDMETEPDIGWDIVSKTDKINIILVFEAVPVESPPDESAPVETTAVDETSENANP